VGDRRDKEEEEEEDTCDDAFDETDFSAKLLQH